MITSIIKATLRFFYPLMKRFLPYDLYAYLAVGAANTALNILLFALFYQVLPGEKISIFGLQMANYTLSLLIAFIATVPTGFWLAKYFAFHRENASKGQTSQEFGKYFLVVLQGLLSDYLLLLAFILLLHFHPTLAKVLSTVVVVAVNFLLQKHFTFKAKTT